MPTPKEKEIDISSLEEKLDYLIDMITNLKNAIGQDHYENNQAIQDLNQKIDHLSETVESLSNQVGNIES